MPSKRNLLFALLGIALVVILSIAAWLALRAFGAYVLFGPYEQPDIWDVSWAGLTMCYGSPDAKQSWTTSDRAQLRSLREAIEIRSESRLSFVAAMTTNEIDITLVNGRRWRLYIFDRTSLTMYDVARPQASFSLAVDRRFYDMLRGEAEAAAAQRVSFFPGD